MKMTMHAKILDLRPALKRLRAASRPVLLLPAVLPILILLLILMTGASGCGRRGESAPPADVLRNVRVLTLERSSVREFFEISGPVQPVRGSDISAEESGTVAAIPHDKGRTVQKGSVLVELDRRLLQAEMESARAGLATLEYNLEKTQQLYEAQKISRIELLNMEAEFAAAKARSRIAELRYQRAAVQAPHAGLVVDRYVELGQLVTPGMPVARVIDPYTLKLAGTLTEREITWVRQGAHAEVWLDGHAEPVPGQVHWVGFEADPKNGKFKVEIYVANPELALRSGVVGRARVLKEDHAQVLAIPRDAVLSTQLGTSVFLVENDTAVRRKISLGPDQGLMVVVQDGLAEGERLVVRGQRELIEGARVQVTEQATAPDGSNGSDPAVVRQAASERRARLIPEGSE